MFLFFSTENIDIQGSLSFGAFNAYSVLTLSHVQNFLQVASVEKTPRVILLKVERVKECTFLAYFRFGDVLQ